MLFPSAFEAQSALHASWRWKNFSIPELACRCAGRFCGQRYWHDPDFLDRLQVLRDRVRQPLILNSAHRCPLWNAAVKGAPHSQHKRLAVDIALGGVDRQELYSASQALGFTGFGLAKTFLHLDCRPQRAVWFYPGSKQEWQT